MNVSDRFNIDPPPREGSITTLDTRTLFQAMLECLPVIAWAMRADGTVVYANRRFAEFAGPHVPFSTLQDRLQLIHPDDHPGMKACREQTLRDGCSQELPVRLRRHDGSWCWHRLHIAPFCEPVTTPTDLFVASAVDIHELKDRSEELRLILDTAAIGLTRVDREYRYLAANAAYARITGVPVAQIIGRTMTEVMGPQAFQHIRPYVERALAGEIVEYETELLWPASGVHWTHVHYAPWHDSDGAVGGWVASVQDITEHKRTEQALRQSGEQLRLATEAAEVGLWDLDMVTGTLFWPPRVKAMFGISPGMPVSMADFYAGLHPEDRDYTSAAFASALDPDRRAVYDVEYRAIGKEDSIVRWVAAKGRGIFDAAGNCVRVIGTAIDISHRKQGEESLRLLNAQLLEADRRKDEFLATLAHELRNPLAPIRTAAQILGSPTLAASQVQWVQQVVNRQVQHLAWLLDDLLDAARITQNKIELKKERLSLSTIVDAAIEETRAQLEAKRHTLMVSLPTEQPELEGDRLRLSQVLSNLLTNAAKFTDPGGRVELSASVGNDDRMLLSVKDNGVGLSADALDSIFRMFSQVKDSLSRTEGGLGIGLALAKGLVTLHGGSIEARSAGLGLGSEFLVRLPLAPARPILAAEQPADPAPHGSSAMRRVLVADDNVDAAESLAMLLRINGHEVRVARDGREAITLAQVFRPEVVLLDLGMPQINGYEAAAKIRQEPWGQSLKLVALTGWGQEKDKLRTAEAGFDRHLTKPVNLEDLLGWLSDPARPASGLQDHSS